MQTRFVKKAIQRRIIDGVISQFVKCECGRDCAIVDSYWNRCQCGKYYDGAGWIIHDIADEHSSHCINLDS